MPLTLPHSLAQDPSSTIHGSPQRSSFTLRVLELWHLASLDAPTVAVVWSLGFAWAVGVRLAVWVLPLLALTVWAVYVFDRLLDARAALRADELSRLRERHYFHWRHRTTLLPAAAVAAGAAAGLILAFMPMAARERNSVLAAASLAYFARVHSGHRARPFLSSLLTKELLVGLLFTAGCALPVFGALRSAHGELWPLGCAAAFFAPLAWLNCHAIDRWESKRQKPQWTDSNFWMAAVLAGAGVLAALPVSFLNPRVGALLAAGAASALLLALLDQRRGKLGAVTLRAAADFVLLSPAALVALAWLTR